ncbi:hypothetical protein BO83DRAFT_106307 [Aspergillus eucalypticola CBS 122712]|uniref:Transmembrane protein n=1 Tax=Aspergillus eucalypticola (strain CBS 122712 / IBT 29274) TaxID=1448314 RepID=A0A317UWZ3_ASPEC|nr:uncharacterized protein BO83DRAFT_106307 [Aspergillus eucalypticola CBS 122712]PWY66544.1 hypothetical protein BO83DRAFT_106307 [Aspergillus eucalypticola CBS 122712]
MKMITMALPQLQDIGACALDTISAQMIIKLSIKRCQRDGSRYWRVILSRPAGRSSLLLCSSIGFGFLRYIASLSLASSGGRGTGLCCLFRSFLGVFLAFRCFLLFLINAVLIITVFSFAIFLALFFFLLLFGRRSCLSLLGSRRSC